MYNLRLGEKRWEVDEAGGAKALGLSESREGAAAETKSKSPSG